MISRALIGIIRAYKRFISPHLPNRCRFYPSCADYSREAIEHHGALRGTWLATKRLSKCHPLHPGGVDNVPEKQPEYLISKREWE